MIFTESQAHHFADMLMVKTSTLKLSPSVNANRFSDFVRFLTAEPYHGLGLVWLQKGQIFDEGELYLIAWKRNEFKSAFEPVFHRIHFVPYSGARKHFIGWFVPNDAIEFAECIRGERFGNTQKETKLIAFALSLGNVDFLRRRMQTDPTVPGACCAFWFSTVNLTSATLTWRSNQTPDCSGGLANLDISL